MLVRFWYERKPVAKAASTSSYRESHSRWSTVDFAPARGGAHRSGTVSSEAQPRRVCLFLAHQALGRWAPATQCLVSSRRPDRWELGGDRCDTGTVPTGFSDLHAAGVSTAAAQLSQKSGPKLGTASTLGFCLVLSCLVLLGVFCHFLAALRYGTVR